MELGIYRHYKGKYYQVLSVAKHSETLEELVVYRAIYFSPEFGDNVTWVRPKSMFLESVQCPDGSICARFTKANLPTDPQR